MGFFKNLFGKEKEKQQFIREDIMKSLALFTALVFELFIIGCASTSSIKISQENIASEVNSGTKDEMSMFVLTGSFMKEDGTPASKVRISIFEVAENGKMMDYSAVATMTDIGTVELIFQCPGTGVTDVNGILTCNVDGRKFTSKEKRFTLVAQYQDPKDPNKWIMPNLRAEKIVANLSTSYLKNGKLNLDDIVGKIIVTGI